MQTLLRVLLVIIICLPHVPAYAQTYDVPKSLKGFDQYMQRIITDWNAPGVAVGIVVKDKLVFAKGYGYRDLEKKLPVTPNTLFAIASNSKLFTAVAAGFLVEEGKLAWDKPIKTFDPSIEFYNQELNNTVTLRDMLSHRTGISRHDGIWYKSDFSRQQLFDRLKYLEPSQPLRQGYLYNNLMYMGVGYVMEHVSGKSWEDYVQEKIFTPLRMKNSFFTTEDMEKQSDFASPYYQQRDTTILVKRPFYRQMQGLGPAGSIVSNVENMSHWLIALMNKGRYEGQQVIPETILSATLQPAMANPNTALDSKGYAEIINPTYGMGRGMSVYKGHFLTNHGGAIGGFYSQVSTLLYDGVGVIVFVNGSHNYPMVDIITRHIYDRLLGVEKTPWHERAIKDYRAGRSAAKESRSKTGADKVPNTKPSHALEEYMGEFEDAAYGIVSIGMKDNALQFDFNHVTLPLEHYHYDRFDTPDDELDGKYSLNFSSSPQGEIDRLVISLDESEVSFTRRPDAALSDPKVLQQYLGKFETSAGQLVEVKSPDNKTLYLVYPGQPLYALVPHRKHTFKMKDFSDLMVEFILEGNQVTGFKMTEPSGVTVMKLKR